MTKRKRTPEFNIKAERVRKGLTQVEMAKLLGISPNSYCMKENGHRSFDLDEFRIICQNLQCDPNDLINHIL